MSHNNELSNSGFKKSGAMAFSGMVFYLVHVLQQAQARDEQVLQSTVDSSNALDTLADLDLITISNQLPMSQVSDDSVQLAQCGKDQIRDPENKEKCCDDKDKDGECDSDSTLLYVGLGAVALGGIGAAAGGGGGGGGGTTTTTTTATDTADEVTDDDDPTPDTESPSRDYKTGFLDIYRADEYHSSELSSSLDVLSSEYTADYTGTNYLRITSQDVVSSITSNADLEAAATKDLRESAESMLLQTNVQSSFQDGFVTSGAKELIASAFGKNASSIDLSLVAVNNQMTGNGQLTNLGGISEHADHAVFLLMNEPSGTTVIPFNIDPGDMDSLQSADSFTEVLGLAATDEGKLSLIIENFSDPYVAESSYYHQMYFAMGSGGSLLKEGSINSTTHSDYLNVFTNFSLSSDGVVGISNTTEQSFNLSVDPNQTEYYLGENDDYKDIKQTTLFFSADQFGDITNQISEISSDIARWESVDTDASITADGLQMSSELYAKMGINLISEDQAINGTYWVDVDSGMRVQDGFLFDQVAVYYDAESDTNQLYNDIGTAGYAMMPQGGTIDFPFYSYSEELDGLYRGADDESVYVLTGMDTDNDREYDRLFVVNDWESYITRYDFPNGDNDSYPTQDKTKVSTAAFMPSGEGFSRTDLQEADFSDGSYYLLFEHLDDAGTFTTSQGKFSPQDISPAGMNAVWPIDLSPSNSMESFGVFAEGAGMMIYSSEDNTVKAIWSELRNNDIIQQWDVKNVREGSSFIYQDGFTLAVCAESGLTEYYVNSEDKVDSLVYTADPESLELARSLDAIKGLGWSEDANGDNLQYFMGIDEELELASTWTVNVTEGTFVSEITGIDASAMSELEVAMSPGGVARIAMVYGNTISSAVYDPSTDWQGALADSATGLDVSPTAIGVTSDTLFYAAPSAADPSQHELFAGHHSTDDPYNFVSFHDGINFEIGAILPYGNILGGDKEDAFYMGTGLEGFGFIRDGDGIIGGYPKDEYASIEFNLGSVEGIMNGFQYQPSFVDGESMGATIIAQGDLFGPVSMVTSQHFFSELADAATDFTAYYYGGMPDIENMNLFSDGHADFGGFGPFTYPLMFPLIAAFDQTGGQPNYSPADLFYEVNDALGGGFHQDNFLELLSSDAVSTVISEAGSDDPLDSLAEFFGLTISPIGSDEMYGLDN